jgi:hypothetical protein
MFNAIYCQNGHFIDGLDAPQDYMTMLRVHNAMSQMQTGSGGRNAFCPQCGEPTTSNCQHCMSPIMVDLAKPLYCDACGKPFPWTETSLAAVREFTDEQSELTSEERATLKAAFVDLTIDSPKTEIAASRFKSILRKLAPDVAETIRKTIVEIASATAVKLLKP